MPRSSQNAPRIFVRFLLALLIASLAAPGCAGPIAQYRERRAIEAAAADESFPSAAQAGLGQTNLRSTVVR